MKCFIDKSELETCTNQIRGLENKPPIFAGMEEWAWIGSYWGVASEHKREAKKHFSDYANILKLKALKLSGKKEAQTLTEQSFWEGLSSFSCHYEDRFCGIHFDQATRELASSGETGLAMVAEYLSGSLVLDEFRDNWPSAGDALPRGIAETVRNNLLRRVAYQEDSSMVEENLDQEELSKYVISRIANRLRLPFYADGVLERVEEMPLDVRHDWSFQIQILFISFSVPYIFAFLFTGFLHFPTVGSRLKKGKNIFARFRYHSKIARKMSLHLAEIETKFYPGFFHGEVEAIQLSGFPADIFLGVRYLRRAKKALQFQALESAERADIEGIFRAVGRLSGRIIPESDETAYEVAAALREKAEKIKDEYLKNQRTHINARRDLIGVMRDLRAVEDVLEARREMLGPTCYELLGVTSEDIEKGGDRAVRDAYRAIIGKIHPDKNGGNICFERLSSLVQGAYERIKTATLREAYYTEISERLSS